MIQNKKGSITNIIAIIGAVLIFVGVAWLIAKNWHQIPGFVKTLILVFATLAAFIAGVFARQNEYEGAGRALIALGGLLYILSVFLIAQIYFVPSGNLQDYAWLLLLSWAIVLLTAYFLDSPENLVTSLIVFFIWLSFQYMASVGERDLSGSSVFGFVLLFLSAGALLYGISVIHNALKHKFTNIFRYWTVLYFLLIFFILSCQSSIPILGAFEFESSIFSIFLVCFIILAFFGFILGVVAAVNQDNVSVREVVGFLIVLGVILVLILSAKLSAGSQGDCSAKTCYDLKTSAECSSAPNNLICKWNNECNEANCYEYKTQEECNSAPAKLNCNWQESNNYCEGQRAWDNTANEACRKYNNQKDNCKSISTCKWYPSYGSWYRSSGLSTSVWILWIINNIVFIGFILLIMWYGQSVSSQQIINLGLKFFIIDIVSRYIGFWMDFSGYFAFSILAILGGILLILLSWLIPKWKKKLVLDEPKKMRYVK